MKHYKDPSNNIYAYAADGSQDEFIKPGLTQITDSELAAIRQPSTAALLADYRQSARSALAATSVTMERIVEAVSLGNTTFSAADVVAWMAYRADLRAAVSANTVGTLPVKPAYPSGT